MRRFSLGRRTLLIAAAIAAGSSIAAGVGAQPYSLVINGTPVIASAFRPGQCLDIRANGNDALLWQCHGGRNQEFRFASGSYGQIRVQGKCLSTSGGGGTSLVAADCRNTPAQRWGFASSGLLRNEQGWCADVEKEGGHGSRVIAWTCGNGKGNQQWMHARFKFGSLVLPPNEIKQAIGTICSPDPSKCIPVRPPFSECINRVPSCFIFLPTAGAMQFRTQ